MLFSTFDQENDNFFTGNCANEFGGGWWCIFKYTNGIVHVIISMAARFCTWGVTEPNSDDVKRKLDQFMYKQNKVHYMALAKL